MIRIGKRIAKAQPGNDEKLEYFRKKILDHLDKLQDEQNKKVIPFPKKKPGKRN